MKIIKIGIFGLGRGGSFYDNILLNNGEVVAVCDMDESKLEQAKKHFGAKLAVYRSFDEFINHPGMEAVFLCNFFHEHSTYAIEALDKGIHVLSECASNSTMAEGVALVRSAEKSKALYMLSENYPFMQFNLEMRRVFAGGTLGKLLYAEGEYNHPLNPADDDMIKSIRPYADHWRNLLPRTYYVTHSLAPLMYMTGAVPVRVTAMPVYMPYPNTSFLKLGVEDRAAIITCQNNDGSVFRITGCAAFGAHDNSYRLCGEKGQIENIRGTSRVILRYNDWDKPHDKECFNEYTPEWHDKDRELVEKAGHGGSDFLVIREFFDCIRENRKPAFDVHFATTMASVGILAHRSLLKRGVPYDIPDFHKESDRVLYEKDIISPFFGADGSAPSIDCCSHNEKYATEEELDAIKARLAQN